ncbi:MAG: hypothetical protein FJ088_15545, partial [Deltaproteobacteria bacterium]|nr:hypothetical protein [Deltaproteobacteria bacterium]
NALDRIAKRMAVEKGYLHLTHYSEPMKRLLRKRSRPIDKVIHLHGWVGWGSEEFIEVDDFVSGLREGRDVEDFFYPSPENIALLAISHALYENGCVSQNDVKKVISALTEMGGRDPAESGGRLLRIARKYGWQNGLSLFFVLLRRFGDAPEYQINTPGGNKRFIKFIERHSEKSKDRIVINRYAAKLLFFDKIFSTEMPAGRKIRSAADTVSRHMLPRLGYARQRPFVVALSGMDGSGKSFYRENLLRKLGDFDLKTGSMWARGGNTGFYLKIKSAVRKVLKPFAGGSGIVRTYERDGKVENPLLVNLWSVAVFLDVVYHYVLLLRIKKGTRRVVVSDRFVEDTFIDLMRRAGGGGGFIRTLFRIAKFLAPVPDRHVFLKVSPENAMK